jgi:hypothetical protein
MFVQWQVLPFDEIDLLDRHRLACEKDHRARSAKGVQPMASFNHLLCVPADDPRLKKQREAA